MKSEDAGPIARQPRARVAEADGWALDAFREPVHRLLDERERQIDIRLKASDIAVSAAFVANEKAIVKSQEVQRAYNERSNEFRGELDGQAKMLMPRSEAAALIRSLG